MPLLQFLAPERRARVVEKLEENKKTKCLKTRNDFNIAKKRFHDEKKGINHSNAMISKELIIENQNSLPKRKLKALRKEQEILTRYFSGDKSASISKSLNVEPRSVYRAVSSFKLKLKRTFQES